MDLFSADYCNVSFVDESHTLWRIPDILKTNLKNEMRLYLGLTSGLRIQEESDRRIQEYWTGTFLVNFL